MSQPHSAFAEGKAIRGGIPICFPWFGAHRAARRRCRRMASPVLHPWELAEGERLEGRTQVSLHCIWARQRRGHARQLAARLRGALSDVTVGETLELALTYTNTDAKAVDHQRGAAHLLRHRRHQRLRACSAWPAATTSTRSPAWPAAHEDRLAGHPRGRDRPGVPQRAQRAADRGSRVGPPPGGDQGGLGGHGGVESLGQERAATHEGHGPGRLDELALRRERERRRQTACELEPGASHRLHHHASASEPL